MSANLKASYEEIDILIVIDTGYIKNNYPKNTDPNNPVEIDQNSQYMISYNRRGIISGQGTTDLAFKARLADFFTFRAVSINQNSDDTVLVYRMDNVKGEDLFIPFSYDRVTRTKTVQPNSEGYGVFPVSFSEQSFTLFYTKLKRDGKGKLLAYIVVYVLGADGNTQELYGYYYFNLQITVTA